MKPGDSVGPYRVLGTLGQGGMGEVFRARDSRLNRDVAIKVLPQLFADDPDRLARFEREAKVLASLNHPNIAHVHGLEESDGTRALVMELVEGRTLAEMIAANVRGIPVADALPIARQIAEALDAAHERGIVHRDLKPANILVTPDGTVKVLDFGLAKALEPAAASQTELMNSPTFAGGVTGAGVVLGTAAYMAPEQARGLAVDRRADIWAFGVVLYELLTGRHAFDGATATDIVAAVVTKDPDWDLLPPSLPDVLVRVLHRCLEKDPKRRMRDIADARAEIEAASTHYSMPHRPAAAPAMRGRRGVPVWAWIAGFVLALGAGAILGRFLLAPAHTPSASVRFEITLPERARAVMAPDGTKLALTSSRGLLIRDLDRLDTRVLQGTDGAESPFWSDDSASLVYGAKGRLWRASLDGSTPSPLGSIPGGMWDHDAGGAWISDGGIVFTNGSSPLMRIPAGGGDPTTVVAVNQSDEIHFHHASGLPDGRGILFVTHRKSGADTIELWTGSERRQLLRLEGSSVDHPVYATTGHILFSRRGATSGLWAVPFSLSSLSLTGQPFLVDAAASSPTISRTSRLAYVPSPRIAPSRLTWFDRDGRQTGRLEDLRLFDRFFALSPDGSVAAVSESADDQWDIWTIDLKSGTRRRLTADGFARNPAWTPDGRSIIYTSVAPNTAPTLKRVAADGSGLLEELGNGIGSTASADSRFVFYGRDFELFYRPLDGSGTEVPFVRGPDRTVMPGPSPDGRLVAYVRLDAATLEQQLLVAPFPSGEPAALKVGGVAYRWSADGRRLLFTTDAAIMEVDVQTTPRVRLGIPRKLFSLRPLGTSGVYPGFDVSADGQRILTLESEPEASIQRVVVVLDFQPGK